MKKAEIALTIVVILLNVIAIAVLCWLDPCR